MNDYLITTGYERFNTNKAKAGSNMGGVCGRSVLGMILLSIFLLCVCQVPTHALGATEFSPKIWHRGVDALPWTTSFTTDLDCAPESWHYVTEWDLASIPQPEGVLAKESYHHCLWDGFSPQGQNSVTVTANDVGDSGDFYTVHWSFWDWPGFYFYFSNWEDLYDCSPGQPSCAGNTVTYPYTFVKKAIYDYWSPTQPDPYPLKMSAGNYTVYAPDGSSQAGAITVPNTDQFTANLEVNFAQRGMYGLIFEGSGAKSWNFWASCADVETIFSCPSRLMSGASFTPRFEVTGITTSTTATGGYPYTNNAVEPVFGDTVNISWQKTYHEFHAQSIVILKRDDINGTIEDPQHVGQKYSPIEGGEVAIDTGTQGGISGWSVTSPMRWQGSVKWPADGQSITQFPAGHHRIGVKYDDGYIELADKYVDVALSVYNVYTTDDSFYPGAINNEGKTTLHYDLSSDANQVSVSIGSAKTLTYTASHEGAHSGTNVLVNAWDGSIGQDQYVDGGSYGLTFNITPPSGQQGAWLHLSGMPSHPGFTPAPPSNQTLSVPLHINEPIRRPQADPDQGKLTAVIYDSDGELVRLLANEDPCNIDNLTGSANGDNTVTWDGKDEEGNIVDPGQYTLTLFAKDNAGVGCESGNYNVPITVRVPPATGIDLEWPYDIADDDDYQDYWYGLSRMSLNDTDYATGVPGYTDSWNTVYYSIDGQQPEQSVDPDYDGYFYIPMDYSSGPHTVAVRTSNNAFPTGTAVSVSFFNNSLTVTTSSDSPAQFDTQTTSDFPINFQVEANDTVSVSVVDPYYQDSCISYSAPKPAADVLNGTVSEKNIRSIASVMSVFAGENGNTAHWDGKNGDGNYVTPGLYEIVISRCNIDGLLDMEERVPVIVEHPAGAPQVSNVVANPSGTSVSVSWNTNVPTKGYVIYASGGNPVGRVNVSGDAARSHVVWLPNIVQNSDYDYYIVATDSASGTSAVSSAGTFSSGGSSELGSDMVTVVSTTEADISYTTETAVAAAIEYAKVVPGLSPLQWTPVEQPNTSTSHTFSLTGLTANSEYVYRITSASDGAWSDSVKSSFRWFATKTASCSIEVVGISDQDTVEDLSDITVNASDASANRRFSQFGIQDVRLYIDGAEVTSVDKSNGTNSLQCVFHAGGMGIGSGLHDIEVVATDDFWQETRQAVRVLLDPGQSQQSLLATASRFGILDAAPNKKPYPKNLGKAVANGGLTLKKARDYLNKLLNDQVSGFDLNHNGQKDRGRAVRDWLSALIAKKSDGIGKARDNTPTENAIALLVLNYGNYKGGDTIGKAGGRPSIPPGNHCNVAIADGFILGNAARPRNYRYEYPAKHWPVNENLHPVNAACMALKYRNSGDRNKNLGPMTEINSAECPWGRKTSQQWPNARPPLSQGLPKEPVVAARGFKSTGGTGDQTHGHCCLYVTGHVMMECRDATGIWFGYWDQPSVKPKDVRDTHDPGYQNGSFYVGLWLNCNAWFDVYNAKGNPPRLVWLKYP